MNAHTEIDRRELKSCRKESVSDYLNMSAGELLEKYDDIKDALEKHKNVNTQGAIVCEAHLAFIRALAVFVHGPAKADAFTP
jgi:virulence-associated protein VapD